MTYETLKMALVTGHNVAFTLEPHLCQCTHAAANKISYTGRCTIESYMIYQDVDETECIAFSSQHLSVTKDNGPVVEISKYVVKKTEPCCVTVHCFFLSPVDYSSLRETIILECKLGYGIKFITEYNPSNASLPVAHNIKGG